MKTLKKFKLLDANVYQNDILSKKAQTHVMGGYDWKCISASCQLEK